MLLSFSLSLSLSHFLPSCCVWIEGSDYPNHLKRSDLTQWKLLGSLWIFMPEWMLKFTKLSLVWHKAKCGKNGSGRKIVLHFSIPVGWDGGCLLWKSAFKILAFNWTDCWWRNCNYLSYQNMLLNVWTFREFVYETGSIYILS